MPKKSSKLSKLPVRHIGNVLAICNSNLPANLREDLGYKRYAQLGVKERFAGQKPYRICARCLQAIKSGSYVSRKSKQYFKKITRK